MRQFLELDAPRLASRLEVEEIECAALAGTVAHRARLLSIQAERLVAQYRVAAVYRSHHMIVLHERRRMDRNEIDVRGNRPLDSLFIARRDDLDFESQLTIHRRHGILAESRPYDRYFHPPPDSIVWNVQIAA